MSAETPPFNPIATLYERYADVNDEVYRPFLESSLPAAGEGERAVDLGCGSGGLPVC